MVLVAAIAAGVLINTAGNLQSQASDTGSQTQEAVANQIEVVHATGTVDTTATPNAVDQLNLTIKKSAGADVIDLEAMTVQYTSSSNDVTLTYGATASADNFSTEDIIGTSGSSLTDTSDRVKLIISTSDIESATSGLQGGDSATLRLVDQSGAQFSYGVSIPSSIDDHNVVEV
jgi:flagellin FlaB